MDTILFYMISKIDDLIALYKFGKVHPVIFLLIVIFVFLFLKGLEILLNFLNKKMNE